MQDPPDDPRETTATLAPDTDRGERDTEPPGEADAEAERVAQTMIPAAGSVPAVKLDENLLVINPQDMPSLLYNQLMRVYQDQLKRDVELFEPEGRFAQLQREQHRQLVIGFKEATAEAFEPKINELAQELRAFSERVTDRLADGERRFLEIESQLKDLRTKFETLSRDLAAAKADARSTPTPATPTG